MDIQSKRVSKKHIIKPCFFLLPTPITPANQAANQFSISGLREIADSCSIMLVEHIAKSVTFCKTHITDFDPSQKEWISIHKQEHKVQLRLRQLFLHNKNVMLMSDAGCPCIADPGYLLVAEAHSLGYQIKPIIGTSAIIIALMSSGLPAQQFSFNGYLPIDKYDRKKAIINFEKISRTSQYTQVFIETPYRNQQLMEILLSTLMPNTNLCVATALLSKHQCIRTMTIEEWKTKKNTLPKENTVFLFCVT